MGKGCNDEPFLDCVEYFWMLVVVVLLTESGRAGRCGRRACCSGADWPQFEAWEVMIMPFFSEAQDWWGTAACLVCFVVGLWTGWLASR